uniref:Uncharacterized protein n=1 Tax=Aegilops tauschii TaxID=37682 RepID=M8BB87_AEGTA
MADAAATKKKASGDAEAAAALAWPTGGKGGGEVDGDPEHDGVVVEKEDKNKRLTTVVPATGSARAIDGDAAGGPGPRLATTLVATAAYPNRHQHRTPQPPAPTTETDPTMVYGGEEALRRQYSIGDEIGHGRFGTVRRCHSNATGEALALKTTPKAPLRDALDLALAEQEPKLHLLASSPPCSPHLVALHAAFDDADAVHLVVDLCAGGDGDRVYLRVLPLRGVKRFGVKGKLAPRLLDHTEFWNPDNLLFDAATGALKLADFGSAEWFGDGRRMSGIVGTPYYVAREVVAGREYGEKVDVWSAGVVLYMTLSGSVPFYGATAPEIFEAVLRGNVRFPPRAFAGVSPEAKDLMRRMLCKDVSRRLAGNGFVL